jgi:adenylate kinase family enzyme
MCEVIMPSQWITVDGIIRQGHQVASGMAKDSPYPRGTIAMQIPFFQKLGMDLTLFFPATLNVSISPYTFIVKQPEYTFRNVEWTAKHPPEDFSFSRCQVLSNNTRYNALIYYPHPETKITHFQDNSTLEILAPFISNLNYGDHIQVEINSLEIVVRKVARKIVIFGNSGSGKTTLALKLQTELNLPMLDLDTITWISNQPGIRREKTESEKLLNDFMNENSEWIIEGCYGSLIEKVATHGSEMIFLNPGIEQCLENNRRRSWEPHKYKTPQEQDANLEFLQTWVREYYSRDDEYSFKCHKKIFKAFNGKKREIT